MGTPFLGHHMLDTQTRAVINFLGILISQFFIQRGQNHHKALSSWPCHRLSAIQKRLQEFIITRPSPLIRLFLFQKRNDHLVDITIIMTSRMLV